MATPAYEQDSETGCKLWGSACDSNSVESTSYCIHGDCYADAVSSTSGANAPKCLCDPGWGGAKCNMPIQWVQFNAGSFIDYEPKIMFMQTVGTPSRLEKTLSFQTNNIELLFIPGKVSGKADLTYGSDTRQQGMVSTSADLTSDGLTPTANFDMGGVGGAHSSAIQLRLPEVNLKENGSYLMKVTRNPTE